MVSSNSSIFHDAVRLIIWPVIGFCVRRAIKIQEINEIIKEVFCNEASKYLNSVGETSNVSKIAAITGIHRRDVMRLTYEDSEKKQPVPLFRKIIGQWQQHKKFSNSNGKAKLLTFEGKDSEFAELVSSVSQDLNPYTVLFELERIGAIKKTSNGTVKLLSEVYIPKGNLKDGFNLLSGDIDDLTRAVEENITLSLDPPHHHVKTHYDNINVDALPEIKEWFLEHGGKFHEKARNFLSKFDKDINPNNKIGGARVAIGSFSFTEIKKEKKK